VNAKQGGIQTVMAQVKYQNLPEHLAIKEGLPSELEVQLKTLSEIFSPSGKMDITAEMDLSKVHEGVNSISVDNKAFKLPLGVSVVKVNPSLIKIVAEKKVYRKLPVAINKLGKPPKGVRIKSINLNPALVTVLGSETEISRTRQIYTEPIDFSTLRKNQSFDVKLQIPSSLVQIKDNDSVRVKVSVTGS
jgi:YbbR domain-containing protein